MTYSWGAIIENGDHKAYTNELIAKVYTVEKQLIICPQFKDDNFSLNAKITVTILILNLETYLQTILICEFRHS